MKTFTFIWSPEGRVIAIIKASTYQKARLQFRAEYPVYRKFMGEVGVIIS